VPPLPAEDGIEDEAAANMGAGTAQVRENVGGGTAALLEGIRKNGEAGRVQMSLWEKPLLVGGAG